VFNRPIMPKLLQAKTDASKWNFWQLLDQLRRSCITRYSYMELRHGRWPWLYRGRLMHWIIGALGASWTYTGRNSLPMTRYAPTLGSQFYPTLFAAAVCHSLDISIAPTLGRIIIELSRPALWPLLVIGDGGLVAPDNPGSEPWRVTGGQWISDYQRRNDAPRTDRHGGYLWQWLRLRQAPEDRKTGPGMTTGCQPTENSQTLNGAI